MKDLKDKLKQAMIDHAVEHTQGQTRKSSRDMIAIGDGIIQVGGCIYINSEIIDEPEMEEEP